MQSAINNNYDTIIINTLDIAKQKCLINGTIQIDHETKIVNEQLWDVEDELRILEKQSDFGERFVKLARSVYVLNDERAAIKKDINLKYKSSIVEEKSY